MAQGVGASSHRAGWAGQLRDLLAEHGHDLVCLNLSASGARVPDVLEQQLPAYDALPSSPAGRDVVVVLIGSNDLFGGPTHRRALPEAMRRLLDRLPAGAVVGSLPQPRAAARAANRHLHAAHLAGRIRPVDLATEGPSSWRGKLAEDFFHPNDAGYAALAEAMLPTVTEAVTGANRHGPVVSAPPDGHPA
jgi:lysophospholipase L1-like esterase